MNECADCMVRFRLVSNLLVIILSPGPEAAASNVNVYPNAHVPHVGGSGSQKI